MKVRCDMLAYLDRVLISPLIYEWEMSTLS